MKIVKSDPLVPLFCPEHLSLTISVPSYLPNKGQKVYQMSSQNQLSMVRHLLLGSGFAKKNIQIVTERSNNLIEDLLLHLLVVKTYLPHIEWLIQTSSDCISI